MKEETAEFVRKLRKIIKALQWLLVVGGFAFVWFYVKSAPTMPVTTAPFGQPEVQLSPAALAEAIKEAKQNDWKDGLLGWALFGIAPAILLGFVLYLMPGGKRKQLTPGDSSGGV